MTPEENERLCRVGPGTPMGALFRRYWLPISTSDRLQEAGGAPRAEKLLGENFVVFRSKDGRIGVLDEFCLHRGASLAMGRVEDCGLRCLYHGWKFGHDGTVLEFMNLPRNRRHPNLKTRAYPVVEDGGIVWVYLGPEEKKPAFSRFGYMDLPEQNRVVVRVNCNYNWVQSLEGGLDSSHVSILHTNAARPGWLGNREEGVGSFDDTRPALEIENTEFGYHYAAIREDDGLRTVRIVPFIMPSGRIIPGGALQGAENATLVMEIPLDDENTATYSVRYGSAPMSMEKRLDEMGFGDPEIYSIEQQKFLFTRENYLRKQDRASMEHNWTGYYGIQGEDTFIATSMGPLYDRSREHLVASDAAVVRLRRILLDSMERVAQGGDPVGAQADRHAVSAVDAPLPEAGHWRDLVPAHAIERENA